MQHGGFVKLAHICSDDEAIISDGDVNSPAPAPAATKPTKAAQPRATAASKAKAKPPAALAAGRNLVPDLCR